MNERDTLILSLLNIIKDYQNASMSQLHIAKWINQFNPRVQIPILHELVHVFQKTYISAHTMTKAIEDFNALILYNLHNLNSKVCLLNIQKGGNSQAHMLQLANELMMRKHGHSIYTMTGGQESFVYLDDVSFSGNRIIRDIGDWIKQAAPLTARVNICLIHRHSSGYFYVERQLKRIIDASGKNIQVQWKKLTPHHHEYENLLAFIHQRDVLSPTSIPDDAMVHAFIQRMNHDVQLRVAGQNSKNNLFSSEAGRHILEQEFLKAGVRIRNQSSHMVDTLRPLGYTKLDTLGFGSLVVTYRNCPNTTPLALWAGDPWYPLFPRTTNTK